MAKVTFAQEMYFPLQSTQALSAYLKHAGHEVDLAIGSASEIVDYIKRNPTDLVAFSVLTAYRNHMLATADALKEAGIRTPLIAGGYDITFMPHILKYSALDIICLGEGGDPIVELCKALDEGKDFRELKIGNLHVKLNDGTIVNNPMRYWLMNLDSAPFDDREIYWQKDPYFRIIPFAQVLAGRGCPYPCTYCFNDGYKKIHQAAGMKGSEYTNLRSPENVIEELKMLAEKYKPRDFFFNDSTLTYNRKWIIAFCEAYRQSGLKQTFSVNGVIPEMNEDVCKALASTKKCRLVRFGLETGNEKFRIHTLRKSIRDQQLIDGTNLLNKYNLRYSMQMMLGLPGETYEYAWDTINMARKITGIKGVHGINIFKPFPGLEINNVGIELGEYQASDVVAPGSVPPPTWRQEAYEDQAETKKEVDLPSDEAYLASRKQMAKTGAGAVSAAMPANHGVEGTDKFGTTKMVFFDNYRRDKLGLKILKLSRYSHLAIRFPGLKPIIEKIIELPDNSFNRLAWTATEGLLNIRVHAAAPWSYFVKYFLFHREKQVR